MQIPMQWLVYHANYFKWFEVGRTELCGYRVSYAKLEMGISLRGRVIVNIKAPAVYDEF